MKTIYVSHPIIDEAMEILQKGASVIVDHVAEQTCTQEEIGKADAILLRIGELRKPQIEKLPKLRVVMRPGVGTDNIDIDYCTQRGIPVAICPGTNLRSVAEHAVALAYYITKNMGESVDETKKGNYSTVRNKYAAIELENHKVGIVGFGNIGRETAKLFAGNGMDVYVYDPYVTKERTEAFGYHYVPELKKLLSVCDVVSLHMPSTPQTRGMFGQEEFAACKKGSFLINSARGDIIQEEPLYEALKSGQLAGAATDVMCVEPFDLDNPLFTLPNFVATPHMAGLTSEASRRTFTMAAANTLALLNGEELSAVVNPEVYQTDAWKSYKATL